MDGVFGGFFHSLTEHTEKAIKGIGRPAFPFFVCFVLRLLFSRELHVLRVLRVQSFCFCSRSCASCFNLFSFAPGP
jgi:hypothetical protein